MSSLADSFLEDLDELGSGSSGDEEETNQTVENLSTPPVESSARPQNSSSHKPTNNKIETSKTGGKPQLHKIATLKRSETYLNHIQTIEKHFTDGKEQLQSLSMQKDSEEYDLVVTSNDLMVQIDDEIAAIHRFLIEMYAPKFPELESLVPNALDYARVVERIGNETDMTLVDLASLLPSATVMSVSVTGSTTSGKPLPPDALEICMEACKELFDLEKDKIMILEFVESRMRFLAPNVAQLVGTRIAAQLIGLAGGVLELARIPSCNLQVLGQQKKVLSGFSSAAALKHTGIIFHCDLIQNVPPYLRIKACRALAGKTALCARVDSDQNASDPDGQVGAQLRQDLIIKMEKWQEPHKAKSKKALPVPDEKPRRKRGGKRYRKLKERLQMTDVRKELNRRSFATADEEYGDNAMGLTAGRLGQEGSGNLRILRKEQKQTAKKLKAASFAAAKQPLSGLSSSLAFTPVQGIELMNPEAATARVREANKKYFSADSGFVSIVKQP